MKIVKLERVEKGVKCFQYSEGKGDYFSLEIKKQTELRNS